MLKKIFAAVIVFSAIFSATANAAPDGSHWIMAQNNYAYLWNPSPTDGETVTWSGGYIHDGGYRYAHGFGTVIWYRYGQAVQVDEGSFYYGRHDGTFKHRFLRSGRVEYSHWRRGVEVG